MQYASILISLVSCYNHIHIPVGDLIIMAEEERSISHQHSSSASRSSNVHSGPSLLNKKSAKKDKDKQKEKKDKSLLGDKGYMQFEADEDPFPTDLGSFRSRADPHAQRDRCSHHCFYSLLSTVAVCIYYTWFFLEKPGSPRQANSERHLSRLERAFQISPERYLAIFAMLSYCLFFFLSFFLVFLYLFAFPMLGIFISQLSSAEVINIRSIVRDTMIPE